VLLDSKGAVVYTDASVQTAAELTAQVAKLAV
jgi:hypothetical protein